MKTVIMGTGGLGGYFGAKLAHAGKDVHFIARGELLRAITQNGLKVQSPYGDFAVDSIHATDNPSEIGPVDLILLCVKTYDLENAIPSLIPLIDAQTAVLPLLNGVEHIARLQAALGAEHILGGISTVSARKGEPGIVHHVANLGQFQLEFGEWDGMISSRCTQIQHQFEQAEIGGTAVANVVERMWWKLTAYCGAGVFAAARGDKSKVWIPEIEALVRRTISEAVAVAHVRQIAVDDTLPDKFVNVVENAPSTYKPSLLVDLEKGSRLEIEATNGYISRLGRELNIAVPANDFIYACLKPYVNPLH